MEKFDGHEKEVTKSFTRAYDDIEVQNGDVKMVLTKSFITEATGLPRMRESWFKNRRIEEREWRVFLKNPGMNMSEFKKGIPVMNLKNKWRNLLLIIQNFITCEGIFGNMFFYHARLMMNFLDGNEINLACFLLQSLRKMVGSIQRKIQSIDSALYHYGLVKILIKEHRRNIGHNWEDLLVRNHFKEAEIEEPIGKTKRTRRKLPIKDNLPLEQEKHSEDETPLADMLVNLIKTNLKRKVTSNKEGISSKEKIEQGKVKK